jgi:nucleoside phosphorylase
VLAEVKGGVAFHHISSAAGAREYLSLNEADLVLVDVNLPSSVDGTPVRNGGFQFLDMLNLEGGRMISPEFLVVTSKDELIDEARVETERRGLALCAVSASNDDWRIFLKGFCERLSKKASSKKPTTVDIAIITAMRGRELEAVLKLPLGWTSVRNDGDPTRYHLGEYNHGGRTVRVVAASCMQKGLSAAAALTAKMAMRMTPQIVVMLGICAGVKGKVNLGDVVIGNPTWDWGAGKHAEADDNSVVFRTGALQSALAADLSEIASDVAEEASTKRAIRSGWEGGVPTGEFSVHIGPMASGASVLAHGEIVTRIQEQNRDLLAVEMEAYGVMAASTACGIPGLAIKAVCDFADAEKHDGWQDYAAYTSAAYFMQLLPKLTDWLD